MIGLKAVEETTTETEMMEATEEMIEEIIAIEEEVIEETTTEEVVTEEEVIEETTTEEVVVTEETTITRGKNRFRVGIVGGYFL